MRVRAYLSLGRTCGGGGGGKRVGSLVLVFIGHFTHCPLGETLPIPKAPTQGTGGATRGGLFTSHHPRLTRSPPNSHGEKAPFRVFRLIGIQR